eukprot:422198-Prymnesium_polylepis.1
MALGIYTVHVFLTDSGTIRRLPFAPRITVEECPEPLVPTDAGHCTCRQGFELNDGSNGARCRVCGEGHYSASSSQPACQRCTPGTFQPAKGSTACIGCAEGEFQAESGAIGCLRCPTGQDSVGGSSQCSICAVGFYRPRAVSPSTKCTPCDLPGVLCRVNATTSTLLLKQKHWRHSTATHQTWRCNV